MARSSLVRLVTRYARDALPRAGRHQAAVFALFLCGATLTNQTTSAQTVDGQLRDQTAVMPIDGALIILLDSQGVSRAQDLTDHVGRFSIRAPQPGQYQLRVERIGYRAWTSPVL